MERCADRGRYAHCGRRRQGQRSRFAREQAPCVATSGWQASGWQLTGQPLPLAARGHGLTNACLATTYSISRSAFRLLDRMTAVQLYGNATSRVCRRQCGLARLCTEMPTIRAARSTTLILTLAPVRSVSKPRRRTLVRTELRTCKRHDRSALLHKSGGHFAA